MHSSVAAWINVSANAQQQQRQGRRERRSRGSLSFICSRVLLLMVLFCSCLLPSLLCRSFLDSPDFAGGPWIPSPSAEASNAQLDPPQGLCGRLICTTQADLLSGASPTAFNLIGDATSSAYPYFTVNDGVPCGGFEGEVRRTDRLCYGRQCVSAPETNVRYYWKLGAWDKCGDCNAFQDRNVTCTRSSNQQPAPEAYCSAQGKPPTRQQCNDDELLCEHSLGGSITLSILGTQLEINSSVVIGTSAAIFVFLMMAMHGCVKCAAKTELDEADREADARAERKAGKAAGGAGGAHAHRAKSPPKAKKRAVANHPLTRI